MDNTLLIAGIGHVLRKDDGIGPYMIAKLSTQNLPSNIVLVNVDSDALSLVDHLQQYQHALIIDAVNMKKPAGSIAVFSSEDIYTSIHSDALSTHGLGLADVLNMVAALDHSLHIKIIGIQPADIGYGQEFSAEIQAILTNIETIIYSEIALFHPAPLGL